MSDHSCHREVETSMSDHSCHREVETSMSDHSCHDNDTSNGGLSTSRRRRRRKRRHSAPHTTTFTVQHHGNTTNTYQCDLTHDHHQPYTPTTSRPIIGGLSFMSIRPTLSTYSRRPYFMFHTRQSRATRQRNMILNDLASRRTYFVDPSGNTLTPSFTHVMTGPLNTISSIRAILTSEYLKYILHLQPSVAHPCRYRNRYYIISHNVAPIDPSRIFTYGPDQILMYDTRHHLYRHIYFPTLTVEQSIELFKHLIYRFVIGVYDNRGDNIIYVNDKFKTVNDPVMLYPVRAMFSDPIPSAVMSAYRSFLRKHFRTIRVFIERFIATVIADKVIDINQKAFMLRRLLTLASKKGWQFGDEWHGRT